MTPRQKRFTLIIVAVTLLGAAIGLVLSAFRDNLVFFITPSDIVQGKARPGQRVRIGGLVESGSIVRGSDGTSVTFRVTDTAHQVLIRYRGALPDLFAENQGAVAEGMLLSDGSVEATKVLAKHDETYMPPEAADAVNQAQKAQKSLKE